MGLTKTEIFTDKQNQLSSLLKAMAHPARIAILQRILISNMCICGDLVAELGLAQATISQHLKELKNVTLVGEETGGSKNVWTALILKTITLPTSRLSLRYGTLPAFFGDITNIDGRGVMPDVPITYRIEDYLAGKDLEMDWVMKDIERNGGTQ